MVVKNGRLRGGWVTGIWISMNDLDLGMEMGIGCRGSWNIGEAVVNTFRQWNLQFRHLGPDRLLPNGELYMAKNPNPRNVRWVHECHRCAQEDLSSRRPRLSSVQLHVAKWDVLYILMDRW